MNQRSGAERRKGRWIARGLTIKESHGYRLADESGKVFNHLDEVANAHSGLVRQRKKLQSLVDNGVFTDDVLNTAKEAIKHIDSELKRLDELRSGIEDSIQLYKHSQK